MKAQAKATRRSEIKIPGSDRPSDWRIGDELITSLSLRLDEFAEWSSQHVRAAQVDLFFDETDKAIASRYEAALQRTRRISKDMKKVSGWDPQNRERIQGTVEFEVRGAPFRIDTKYLGNVHVVGKDHPLVLAADIVSNHLYRHLGNLPSNAPLNAPTSIAGWRLEERVWGVSEGASENLY